MHPITATRSPGQSLGIASLPNLRDVGGYTSRDGRVVRSGRLYRSGQLNPVSEDDLREVEALGLRLTADLRTAQEAALFPDVPVAGAEALWLDVLGDAHQADPSLIERLLENVQQANEMLGGGRADDIVKRIYRAFVSLPSARQAYGRLFASLAEAESMPALFHCTAGKDRTGWAAAALLTLLGVPEDAVMEDYLRSNDYILPGFVPLSERFLAAGGDPAVASAIFGVRREFLETAFDEVRQRHGDIDQYFGDGLGLDAAARRALRDACLEG